MYSRISSNQHDGTEAYTKWDHHIGQLKLPQNIVSLRSDDIFRLSKTLTLTLVASQISLHCLRLTCPRRPKKGSFLHYQNYLPTT